MKKITNNKKGAKMRKFILPLLVAGAVAITASQAFAAGAVVKGEFSESHAFKDALGAGDPVATMTPENPYVSGVQTIDGGNHYKTTDFVENGRHGFQLRSSVLKSMAGEVAGFKADDAVGFVTGDNPFAPGGMVGLTEWPMEVPQYTAPCPEWVDGDTNIKTPGDCEANAFATDPQTDINDNTWDGVVLDDLYQAVGAVDVFKGIRTTGPNAGVFTEERRALDQNLDILFYLGKRGTIVDHINKDGVGPDTLVTLQTGEGADIKGNKRHMNIDQTLDQDVTDWITTYHDTVEVAGQRDETMGIYGKLTQLYQNAGRVSSTSGCASGGVLGQDQGGLNASVDCSGVVYYGDGVNNDGNTTGWEAAALRIEQQQKAELDPWAAFIVDQWIVSDVFDWHHRGDSNTTDYKADKEEGFGIKQSYSSWFRDGDHHDWDISHTYDSGHGSTAGTVAAGNHNEHPDP